MQENFIVGLVSGLVVTIFVVTFKKFWEAVIIPWFEERVYKDVKIEGKWYGINPTTKDLEENLITLKRHGHTIQGTMICVSGADEGTEFKLCGSFRNMLLPLTYEENDKTKTDRGTITLKVINNGEEMKGILAFYHNQRDSIETANVHWYRNKSKVEAIKKRNNQ
ncbi:hypothetical protein [Vibrio cholerae]|uniref:hypothetical protein n=1 Tax=Vibrio cholerae TaxID=666 RepID=UPI003967BCB8